jgi:hypothetical protein
VEEGYFLIPSPLSDSCIKCRERPKTDLPVKSPLTLYCTKCLDPRLLDLTTIVLQKKIPTKRRRLDDTERRAKYLRMMYNITPKQYAEMLVAQDRRCAVCKRREPRGKDKYFHVDHDHKTGKVRGLLCSFCNAGLGMFEDDPERMRAAIAYLASAPKEE